MPTWEDIHESFRHYRNSAVALSATIIAISGAMLLRLDQLPTEGSMAVVYPHIKIALQFTFTICVVLGLLIQYRHFQGYKDHAHSELYELYGEPPKKVEDLTKHILNPERGKNYLRIAENYRVKSDDYFDVMEKITGRAVQWCINGIGAFYIWSLVVKVVTWKGV